MSTVIYPEGEREISKLDLFLMIRKLSRKYIAVIGRKADKINLIFVTSEESEFVCSWSIDPVFFEKELKSLFTKHNSSYRDRKEQ